MMKIPIEYAKSIRRHYMNLNKVARRLTRLEKGKHQVNIGDVKELLKKLFTKFSLFEIIKIWFKYRGRR